MGVADVVSEDTFNWAKAMTRVSKRFNLKDLKEIGHKLHKFQGCPEELSLAEGFEMVCTYSDHLNYGWRRNFAVGACMNGKHCRKADCEAAKCHVGYGADAWDHK